MGYVFKKVKEYTFFFFSVNTCIFTCISRSYVILSFTNSFLLMLVYVLISRSVSGDCHFTFLIGTCNCVLF
jgi:uncharacterized membrane protein